MQETSLQQIFALVPATVSHYLTSGLPILLQTLHSMTDAQIQWPWGPDFEWCSALVIAHHPRLQGAFRSINGLKLPVQTSKDDEIENATYNGWLSEHFISFVITFSAEGIMIAARTNAPGSWHDSRQTHRRVVISHNIHASLPDSGP
ncbi:hypothetical protein BDR06DRAFT_1008331 [Suillus hirtellus]|nr:hypothetical protein BDR06DRAFT_1008331 [Suillus hirtellus]